MVMMKMKIVRTIIIISLFLNFYEMLGRHCAKGFPYIRVSQPWHF